MYIIYHNICTILYSLKAWGLCPSFSQSLFVQRACGLGSQSKLKQVFTYRTELVWASMPNVYLFFFNNLHWIVHWPWLKWKKGHQSHECGWKFNMQDSLHILSNFWRNFESSSLCCIGHFTGPIPFELSCGSVVFVPVERLHFFGFTLWTWLPAFCSLASPDSCVHLYEIRFAKDTNWRDLLG